MTILTRGGVEDTRLEAKYTKKSEAKNSPSQDRLSRGQRPGASPAGGQGGQCLPDFRFYPPDFFLPPTVFFGRKKLLFLGGKNVKICDFGQKKPLDFGEDLFFFFENHLLLVGKFVISARKSLRISAKTFFFIFGDHLLLIEKFVISARKSLRISAKTFAPLILILPPRSREAGDAPAKDTGASVFKKSFFQAISKKKVFKKIFASARVK